ncbi:tiny macrocysts protein B [Haematococcus lacustris]|uniref:Tiny macrocysts protein B n=1 Tax=Haematococcus lacustris TaxID=44745 RepID=A0A699Z3L6_HAELA|nr:tiny macrocysts protein B [Haematococcus lacustris]
MPGKLGTWQAGGPTSNAAWGTNLLKQAALTSATLSQTTSQQPQQDKAGIATAPAPGTASLQPTVTKDQPRARRKSVDSGIVIELHLWRADLLSGLLEVESNGRVCNTNVNKLCPPGLVLGCASDNLVQRPVASFLPLANGLGELFSEPARAGSKGPVKSLLKSDNLFRTDKMVGPVHTLNVRHMGDGADLELSVQIVRRVPPYRNFFILLHPVAPQCGRPDFRQWLYESDGAEPVTGSQSQLPAFGNVVARHSLRNIQGNDSFGSKRSNGRWVTGAASGRPSFTASHAGGPSPDLGLPAAACSARPASALSELGPTGPPGQVPPQLPPGGLSSVAQWVLSDGASYPVGQGPVQAGAALQSVPPSSQRSKALQEPEGPRPGSGGSQPPLVWVARQAPAAITNGSSSRNATPEVLPLPRLHKLSSTSLGDAGPGQGSMRSQGSAAVGTGKLLRGEGEEGADEDSSSDEEGEAAAELDPKLADAAANMGDEAGAPDHFSEQMSESGVSGGIGMQQGDYRRGVRLKKLNRKLNTALSRSSMPWLVPGLTGMETQADLPALLDFIHQLVDTYMTLHAGTYLGFTSRQSLPEEHGVRTLWEVDGATCIDFYNSLPQPTTTTVVMGMWDAGNMYALNKTQLTIMGMEAVVLCVIVLVWMWVLMTQVWMCWPVALWGVLLIILYMVAYNSLATISGPIATLNQIVFLQMRVNRNFFSIQELVWEQNVTIKAARRADSAKLRLLVTKEYQAMLYGAQEK